jgi:hypothetical protein
MAFNAANLTQLAHGNGFALWHYKSADAIATLNTAAYFDDASDMLSVRDVIICVDTNTPTTDIVSVLTNASGVVDVSNGLAITEADAD